MTRVFKLDVKFLGANRLLVFFCDFQLGIIEFVGGAQKKNTDGVSGLTQEFYKARDSLFSAGRSPPKR